MALFNLKVEIVYLNWLLKRYNKTFILCNNREAGIYFTWAFYHDFIQKYFVYLKIVAQHLWFWKNMECKIYLQNLREGDEKMLFLFQFFFGEKRPKNWSIFLSRGELEALQVTTTTFVSSFRQFSTQPYFSCTHHR